jgi:pyruvate dehydrogenase E2 component (dihydrolipoamide acetyltransferase)
MTIATYVFRLPDLGEGLEEATVLDWLVAPEDTVDRNDPIAEVDTAKAAVEIPSPVAGRVTALHVARGETVAVGAPFVTFETAEQGGIVGTVPADVPVRRRVRLRPPE